MQAAAENNTMAMYAMGRIYYYGLGVPKDDRQAIVWYQKGVDLGSMRARNSLALLYYQGGDGFYKDRVKALSLLIASACQEYVVAQNNFGVLYSDGAEDVIADHKKAVVLFLPTKLYCSSNSQMSATSAWATGAEVTFHGESFLMRE
ncbi:putative beta-lactamase hcpD Penicillin-binding protein 4; PBP 4; Cysteine-rich protein D;Flags: Precursor [Salmonella enterica subsp. houtenae]|nr:putative beta-lactamase hcpD Penicillin-binding protein 4; PBP 4; Cysteine-rich protein D;Flags: Precursor [Salmonella enterica subsp. houtenae]